jgi:hypothetical protein
MALKIQFTRNNRDTGDAITYRPENSNDVHFKFNRGNGAPKIRYTDNGKDVGGEHIAPEGALDVGLEFTFEGGKLKMRDCHWTDGKGGAIGGPDGYIPPPEGANDWHLEVPGGHITEAYWTRNGEPYTPHQTLELPKDANDVHVSDSQPGSRTHFADINIEPAAEWWSDPLIPFEAQLQEAIRAQRTDAENARLLADTNQWVNANKASLRDAFGDAVITVVHDPSAGGGYRPFVARGVYEAESLARRARPGLPLVTLNPSLRHMIRRPALSMIPTLFKSYPAVVLDLPMLFWLGNGLEEMLKRLEQQRKDGELTDDTIKEKWKGPLLDSSGCPHTIGMIKDSAAHEKLKLWAVDSQASTSVISQANFDAFKKLGATPKLAGTEKGDTAAGEVTGQKYSGITMRFVRDDGAGKNEFVECDVPVLVMPSGDLLGADQMKKTGTRLVWDPGEDGGSHLEKRPEKKK